jgi:hypothetical protein
VKKSRAEEEKQTQKLNGHSWGGKRVSECIAIKLKPTFLPLKSVCARSQGERGVWIAEEREREKQLIIFTEAPIVGFCLDNEAARLMVFRGTVRKQAEVHKEDCFDS